MLDLDINLDTKRIKASFGGAGEERDRRENGFGFRCIESKMPLGHPRKHQHHAVVNLRFHLKTS